MATGIMTDAQDETIRFLSAPQSYGVDRVTSVQTHGAIVFLAGRRAYKLKRAVCYPYMDYSTPERRRYMCEREIEVNRKLAPGLYLGVKDIVLADDGRLHFAPLASGRVVDTVVEMVRFSEGALLSRRFARHDVDLSLIRTLAGEIADFHDKAELTPLIDFSSVTRGVVEENVMLLRAANCFDELEVEDFAQSLWRTFRCADPLLKIRNHSDIVRRCHGDLHLNNIVVIDGKPVLFDAIEFNDSYVFIDPLYDIGFLVMDLERIDEPAFAHALFNRYCELRPDDEGLALLPLYLSLRAAIRAHVAVSRSASGDSTALDEARRCFTLARNFLTPPPPQLIAIGGFSGSGKSTLARTLAPATGAAPGALILRSDVIRKRLMGAAETERLPPSAYTEEVNARVFAKLEDRARAALASGHSVIMDSVYGRPEERARIKAVALTAGAAFYGLWLEAPYRTLSNRISARRGDASDATLEVLDLQLQRLIPPSDWRRLDADLSPQAVAALAKHLLLTNRG